MAVSRKLYTQKTLNLKSKIINLFDIVYQESTKTYDKFTINTEYTVKIQKKAGYLSKRVFKWSKKIEKEITETNNKPYTVNKNEIIWCCLGDYKTLIHNGKAVVIDLNSAYVTFLKGIVTDKLIRNLKLLPKKERLIALGLIARNHAKLIYQNSELMAVEQIFYNKDFYNIFLYCCKKTSELIHDIALVYSNNTIYTYFDEIVLTELTNEDIHIIENMITHFGCDFKIDFIDRITVPRITKSGVTFLVETQKKRKEIFIGNTYNVNDLILKML